jgi:splicing factor 3B subunit 2
MTDNTPPPWLINMQRYGPPPSYPSLRIPGLNAPIPPGASFGYHPGGWGKPPVDEFGRPLYGDVFCTCFIFLFHPSFILSCMLVIFIFIF